MIWIALPLCVGCVGFSEYVARDPAPIRFGCPSEGVEPDAPFRATVGVLRVLDARPEDARGRAGELPDGYTDIRIDARTFVPEQLRLDLVRRFAARGIRLTQSRDPRPVGVWLEIALLQAEARADHGFFSGRGVIGRFRFRMGIWDSEKVDPIWFTAVEGRHVEAPIYTTSRTYEAALNGAYCAALDEAIAWLETPPFRRALESSWVGSH